MNWSSPPHLHRLYLLVVTIPGDELAVLPPGQQRAVPQHAQSKDAALVGSLDHLADAICSWVDEKHTGNDQTLHLETSMDGGMAWMKKVSQTDRTLCVCGGSSLRSGVSSHKTV